MYRGKDGAGWRRLSACGSPGSVFSERQKTPSGKEATSHPSGGLLSTCSCFNYPSAPQHRSSLREATLSRPLRRTEHVTTAPAVSPQPRLSRSSRQRRGPTLSNTSPLSHQHRLAKIFSDVFCQRILHYLNHPRRAQQKAAHWEEQPELLTSFFFSWALT